uniref:Uncharacterized protein n=1 Tax=Oryza rufipogon TaxID=4529 RepID=A0A0E0NE45_ORYRU
CRRSGHPSLSLRLPPPSPGARCSGTPSPTGVPTSRPPESRRPARPLLSLLSDQRSREEEEVEETYDKRAPLHQKATVETLHLLWRRSRGLKPRRQTCRSSHPTPQRVQWSEPHYSLDLHKHAAH